MRLHPLRRAVMGVMEVAVGGQLGTFIHLPLSHGLFRIKRVINIQSSWPTFGLGVLAVASVSPWGTIPPDLSLTIG